MIKISNTYINKNLIFSSIFALLVVLISLVITKKSTQQVHAAADNIVINELMYHPLSDLDNDDYIELYNPTSSPIDISGWCFTAGITGCFANGTTVGAGQYIVAAKNIAQAQTIYGVTAVLEYGGNLSNSGETITLTNASSAVVDTLTYSDHSPWPASPDGTGPSLELKDPNLDNSLPTSWLASINSPTPASQNSIVNTNLPTVTIQDKPTGIGANASANVTATVANVATVELIYRVNFDAEQTLTMYDDGLHGDGAVGDNVFGATIPGQFAGKLVRYKVSATSIGGSATAPSNDDSMDYFGYVVQDPSQAGTTPILQWFITDANYTSLINEDVNAKVYYPCVIAYGDQVFDNSQIRIKGEYSATFDKLPFKVKLPSGYSLEMPGTLTTPLSEFHLNSDFPNNNYVVSLTSWRAFERAGFTMPQLEKVQLQRNGSFEGAYTLAEKYDKEWLDRFPQYKTGNLYEDYWEKKYPSDNDRSDIESWRTNMSQVYSNTKRQYMLDNNNIPNIINFMATSAVIRHHDWSAETNVMAYHDTAGTGRWSVLPWDLDLSLQQLVPSELHGQGYGDMIDPSDTVPSVSADARFFARAIWEDPELKAMYQRRIRTLVESIYGDNWIQDTVDIEYAKAQTAAEQDYTKWYNYEFTTKIQPIIDLITGLGFDTNSPEVIQGYTEQSTGMPMADFPDPVTAIAPLTPANRIAVLKHQLTLRKNAFLGDYVDRGLIPSAQPSNARVLINEINYNPIGGPNHEYIEFYNSNNYAVDMSGWQIESIGLTLPGGSVIAAGSYALVVKNDPAFRAQYGGGKLILAEYSGELNNESAILSLANSNNQIVDTASYGIVASPGTESFDSTGAVSRDSTSTLVGLLASFEASPQTPGDQNPNECEKVLNICSDGQAQDTNTSTNNSQPNQEKYGLSRNSYIVLSIILVSTALIGSLVYFKLLKNK